MTCSLVLDLRIGSRTARARDAGRAGDPPTLAASRASPPRTLFDPLDHLVVVVLSNTSAEDGRAGPLAAQVIRFIDFAQAHPGGSSAELTRYTGRFANVGGAVDIVAFGGKVFGLAPESDNPTKFASELDVVNAYLPRINEVQRLGYPGESIHRYASALWTPGPGRRRRPR
jgi:hypothetical protein